MKRAKMISFRMQEDLLKEVDNYVKCRSYLTRSSLIEKCVVAIMRCGSCGVKQKVLDTYDPFAEGVKISVHF